MYNKYVAGFLALFLGIFGAHDFYLGRRLRAIAQLASFWVLVFLLAEGAGSDELFGMMLAVTCIIPFITALLFFFMPEEQFNARFNPDAVSRGAFARPLDQGDVQELKREGITYFKSGDYDLAIDAFQDALKAAPNDRKIHFNLACCHSSLHDAIAALHHLELSVSHGLTVMDRISTHPALTWLRAQPSFDAFVANNYRRRDYRNAQEAAPPEPEMELMELNSPIMAVEATDELLNKLSKLGDLRERGLLTEREFAQRKERLLNKSQEK
ncbi:MAG: NINE protein [Bacteroidota bacterium]